MTMNGRLAWASLARMWVLIGIGSTLAITGLIRKEPTVLFAGTTMLGLEPLARSND